MSSVASRENLFSLLPETRTPWTEFVFSTAAQALAVGFIVWVRSLYPAGVSSPEHSFRSVELVSTYAYTLEEIQTILSLLPEPSATAFAVAAFMGLRHGKFKVYCGRTTGTGNYFVSVRSGMAASQTPRLARVVPRFLLSDNWRIGWSFIGCAREIRLLVRSSPTVQRRRSRLVVWSIASFFPR
jgi:hypothetical protein